MVIIIDDHFIFPSDDGNIRIMESMGLTTRADTYVKVTPDAIGCINPSFIKCSDSIRRPANMQISPDFYRFMVSAVSYTPKYTKLRELDVDAHKTALCMFAALREQLY